MEEKTLVFWVNIQGSFFVFINSGGDSCGQSLEPLEEWIQGQYTVNVGCCLLSFG